jgi:hypothetical protein
VHLLIAVNEVIYLAGLGKPALASEQGSQMVEIVIVHVLARVAHCDPLECLTHGDQLSPLHRREVAHDHLAAGPGLEQAFLEEGVESLPDWSLRHSQRFGDRPFSKNRSCLQTLPEYLAAQVLICLLGQPP